MAFDPYAILGVTRDVTFGELRRIYRELARRLHPDVNKAPDADDRFKELNLAYTILSDEGRRRDFDEFGEAVLGALFDADRERLVREAARAEEAAAVLGGTRPQQQTGPQPTAPRDIVLPLRLDADKARAGGVVRVAAPVGGGVLTVRVPAGAKPGQRLRLMGKGKAGPAGRPGDLYLEIILAPSDSGANGKR